VREFEHYIPSPSIVDIQRCVGEVFGVTRTELLGRSRKVEIAHARAIGISICRQVTGASLPKLGIAWQRQHYSTVLYLNRRGHHLRNRPEYRAKTEAVISRLDLL
jgi:chromosomal replication initiator protein